MGGRDARPLRDTTWLRCTEPDPGSGRTACDTASLSYFTDDASAFDAPARRSDNSSDKDLQRAEGSCRIVLGSSERGTRVMDVRSEERRVGKECRSRWSPYH